MWGNLENSMNVYRTVFEVWGALNLTLAGLNTLWSRWQGEARQILARPLFYTSSGILLFQIWLKLGLDLGETEAKSSNNLLAAYFSCNKISDKIKQAVALQ